MNGGAVVVFGKAGGVCFGLSFGRSFTHHDILNIDSQIYGKKAPKCEMSLLSNCSKVSITRKIDYKHVDLRQIF